ncbi:MAG: preprotein translocase subunit SecY [Verrucomicrobiales bacterium]|nr:preprotein translocase subunit SecY [Verrucomicrobiales bacterium]
MLSNIANTFTNCFKIPELKSRILYTLLVLAVCRLAALIPVPGLDATALKVYFENSGGAGGIAGMYSLFTGGGFENCAVGALGIMPYISATIILQLLTAVVPSLSKMAREEGGRTNIIKYGRYLTVLLCLGQGFMMALSWQNPDKVFPGFTGNLVMVDSKIWYLIQTTLILTTGTVLLMWLGEQITERGIGNGVSLVITIGILARLPKAGQGLMDMFHPASGEPKSLWILVLLIVLLILVIGAVIAVTQAQRKIPVQYAQRAVGRKVYSGGSSFLPLRVNYAGVMPVIFAQALLMFPAQIFSFIGGKFGLQFFSSLANQLQAGSIIYISLYALLILAFSYFWVATQFNELQIADDMKKSGGYIPGVRPGQPTSDFLHNSMSRITFAGALFLTIIAVIPILLAQSLGINQVVAQFFGGTSMLIMVGVMLDTMRQMESYLLMRHYDGFLKKGRIKGRF